MEPLSGPHTVPLSTTSPTDLADLAAASPLALKVKNIDKPSKSMQNKRSNSTSSLPHKTSAHNPRPRVTSEYQSDTRNTPDMLRKSSRTPHGFQNDSLVALPSPFRKQHFTSSTNTMSDSPSGVNSHHYTSEQRYTKDLEPDKSHSRSPFSRPSPGLYCTMTSSIATLVGKFDFVLTKRPWRIFEWCDLSWTPDIVRHTCQDILAIEWTRKLPFVQMASPAFTAAEPLANVIDAVAGMSERELEVFEFCAGSGGPTPVFERLINQHRRSCALNPIQFNISDKYPNPSAWKRHTDSSDWLTSIEEPVDAMDPPDMAMSCNSLQHISPSNKRIFRLYNCSFHHFDDETAVEILKSTIETSDGFAIIELQDRRWLCLLMMFFNIFFVLPLTPFWYTPLKDDTSRYRPKNLVRNIFTYFCIMLVLQWDGIVSCLRTREFSEFVQLIEDAAEIEGNIDINVEASGEQSCELLGWCFREHSKILHTWPGGYVRMFTGVRMSPS